MGETLQPVTPGFNRSLRIVWRPDRLTGDPGAVVLREILERSGIVAWMCRLRERVLRAGARLVISGRRMTPALVL